MPCGSTPADFCLVCNKIMLENPHTFLMKTGSDISDFEIVYENDGIAQVCYIIETKASLPENADLAGRFYITSTWKKQADGFKLIFNMDQRIK